jgi:hypothetical protein
MQKLVWLSARTLIKFNRFTETSKQLHTHGLSLLLFLGWCLMEVWFLLLLLLSVDGPAYDRPERSRTPHDEPKVTTRLASGSALQQCEHPAML